MNEDIDVWRPVAAQHIDRNIFLILESEIPVGKEWEFVSGNLVEVQSKISDGKAIMVATAFAK